MNGITSSHSALSAYQRKTAVEPVSVRESPVAKESGGASGSARATRVAISEEARTVAPGGEIDRAKVERLRRRIQSGDLKFDAQLIAQRLIDK